MLLLFIFWVWKMAYTHFNAFIVRTQRLYMWLRMSFTAHSIDKSHMTAKLCYITHSQEWIRLAESLELELYNEIVCKSQSDISANSSFSN